MRALRRLGTVILVSTGLAIPACSISGVARLTVDVDDPLPGDRMSLTAYLPSIVVAHPGDTVVFKSHFTGEPHTVTAGRLVDAALSENSAYRLSGGADESPLMKQLPRVRMSKLAGFAGPASRPCFLNRGDSSAVDRCSRGPHRQFNGRQSFYSSGVLASNESFSIPVSRDTVPAAYGIICLVHGPKMAGEIKVVDKDVPIPSAAQVRSRASRERLAAFNALQAFVSSARDQPPSAALAGLGVGEVQTIYGNDFFPARAAIAPGGSVIWNVFGSHTISFNTAATRLLSGKNPPRLAVRAVAPYRSPRPPDTPALSLEKSGGPATPTVVDAGVWNGAGRLSSGLLFSFPPRLLAFKLTFSAPGKYRYQCLIKPSMTGVVQVG